MKIFFYEESKGLLHEDLVRVLHRYVKVTVESAPHDLVSALEWVSCIVIFSLLEAMS